MKNISLDDGLRFIYLLCTVNTAILASVKHYSIEQMKKKRMLNILMCFIVVAVVKVYKQTYVVSLCVD